MLADATTTAIVSHMVDITNKMDQTAGTHPTTMRGMRRHF